MASTSMSRAAALSSLPGAVNPPRRGRDVAERGGADGVEVGGFAASDLIDAVLKGFRVLFSAT